MDTSRCKGSWVCASHCSAVGEWREQGVLFLSCERVAEVQRGTQSCLNVQHSHAPESMRLWPRAPHTPRTQMLDVSSVFKKRALTCVHTCTLRSTPGPGLATGERCHTLDTLWQDQQLPESSWGKRGTIFCLFMLSCPKQHWNKIQSFNTATNCPHNVITTFSEVFTQSLMNFAVMPKRKRAYMQPCRQRENKTIRPHLRMVTNIWNGQSSNQRA